jgi:hypothetical protein
MTNPEHWIDEVQADSLTSVNAGIAEYVRMTGTEDERKAFDFIADTLANYGLNTTLHLPTCLVSNPIRGELSVGSEGFRPPQTMPASPGCLSMPGAAPRLN